jgi:exopolyphosphatase/guanosine-5'-triphosphate,3'-diphosphate pyrophosphatase
VREGFRRVDEARGEVAWPLRVGAIDMGSNAIRYMAAEFTSPRAYTVLDEERAAVRLGHGVFLSGRLAPSAMDGAIAAMASFAARMRALGVEYYRAVATSAVREARNGEEFLERMRAEAGLELEVIGGSDEARLVYLAVRRVVPLAGREWILVDLGGGSVEVSLVDDSGILWSESHTMGSVRLLEELSEVGQEPGRFRRLLEEYTATLRLPSAAAYRSGVGFVATGGNIESLARLAGVEAPPRGFGLLPVERLQGVIDTLARMSYAQRVAELGLREDRADVVLPAAMVYLRLAQLTGAAEIHVPFVGIREGVLFDAVEALTTRPAHADRQQQELLAAAVALGRRFMFDESHARQVCAHALSLYDQLVELHGLGEEERKVLAVAALLHDTGAYISYKKHHKHSMYLIAHSELPGLSARAVNLAAVVARYHRRSEPADRHPEYAGLPARDQEAVTRLAALLRLADALDREHREKVKAVHAHLEAGTLHLRLVGDGDLYLEKWALERKSQLFKRAFKLAIKVHNGSAG